MYALGIQQRHGGGFDHRGIGRSHYYARDKAGREYIRRNSPHLDNTRGRDLLQEKPSNHISHTPTPMLSHTTLKTHCAALRQHVVDILYTGTVGDRRCLCFYGSPRPDANLCIYCTASCPDRLWSAHPISPLLASGGFPAETGGNGSGSIRAHHISGHNPGKYTAPGIGLCHARESVRYLEDLADSADHTAPASAIGDHIPETNKYPTLSPPTKEN